MDVLNLLISLVEKESILLSAWIRGRLDELTDGLVDFLPITCSMCLGNSGQSTLYTIDEDKESWKVHVNRAVVKSIDLRDKIVNARVEGGKMSKSGGYSITLGHLMGHGWVREINWGCSRCMLQLKEGSLEWYEKQTGLQYPLVGAHDEWKKSKATIEWYRSIGVKPMTDEERKYIQNIYHTAAYQEQDKYRNEISGENIQLARDREVARKCKDFAESDRIRDKLQEERIEVRDVSEGTILVKGTTEIRLN